MLTVTFEAHELDTRTGIWCPTCALPSVVEVDVALVLADTLHVLHRVTGSLCESCGAEDVTR